MVMKKTHRETHLVLHGHRASGHLHCSERGVVRVTAAPRLGGDHGSWACCTHTPSALRTLGRDCRTHPALESLDTTAAGETATNSRLEVNVGPA